MATKDYKPLVFHEILEKYIPKNIRHRINPPPAVGGVGKFIRDKIKKQKIPMSKQLKKVKKNGSQQRKHGGRGWLHYDFNF